MRTWRTLDGGILVEGARGTAAVDPYPVLTAAGDPIADPHEYFLLDAEGTLRRHYFEISSAFEDELHAQTYQVVGEELREYHSFIAAVPWRILPDGTTPRRDSEEVQLTGLVPVPATDALGTDPAATLAQAREKESRRAQAARERADRPYRLACEAFSAALDGYAAEGPVALTFAYRDGLQIHDAAETVVWRPAEQPAVRGKSLHYMLENLLKARYGDRADRLRVDLGDAPWWFWAPDE